MTLSDSNHRSGDRRRYYRFLGEPLDITVRVHDRTIQGKLTNESIGGFAFTTQDPLSLSEGQPIRVTIRDEDTTAYVRSVCRLVGGRLRVSVSWDQLTHREANSTMNYLSHEDLMLLCEVVQRNNDPVTTVRLWDGAEFQVMPDDVYTRSYEERRDELHRSPAIISTLAQLYGLNSGAEGNEIVSAILEFEFSGDLAPKASKA